MRNKNKSKIYLMIVILVIVSMACGVFSSTDGNEANENTANNDAENSPADTPMPDAPESTEVPVEASQIPTPTVAHVTIPGDPPFAQYYVIDLSSKGLASQNRAELDYYQFMVLERPFTTEVMDYISHIDLTRAEVYSSYPWMYFTIFLEGAPPADSAAVYGIELDLDIDGRGDWLVIGEVPADTTWTSEGVFVYEDKNNDIGGPSPMFMDSVQPNIDGYEDLYFDQGYNTNDPDNAWIRRNPANAQQIQIAIKTSIIGDDPEFLWGAWAHDTMPDPALYDLHDKYPLAEAGSPLKPNSDYPLKKVAAVDNTCRWSFGFTPVDNIPGLCYLPPTPTPTPQPASIYGGVYNDLNRDSLNNNGEIGLPNEKIYLGTGSCTSTGFADMLTLADGSFSFLNIPAGNYCVSVDKATSIICDGWTASTPKQYDISLSPGEMLNLLWFGFYPNLPCIY